MADRRWYCTRQRAGPLVKECRALRPRLSADDSAYEHSEKMKILQPPRDSSVCRNRVDRLELRLALFGYEGCCYTLTFDDAHLPSSFREARASLRAFNARLQRWHQKQPFDRVNLIEGKHGDHRYHLHMVLRYSDFSPEEIRYLWRQGNMSEAPLLRMPHDSFRRMAKYYNKESSDGIVIPVGSRPWTCSRSLTKQLGPPKQWLSSSGTIRIPSNVFACGRNRVENEFGVYNYAWYIDPKPTNSFI